MSYEPVAAGELAAVVTFLEMRERPAQLPPPAPLALRREEQPDVGSYRELFRRIGSPWLWNSRLTMSDTELMAIIGDPAVELYRVVHDEEGEVGMLELDFREAGEAELAFVGFTPEFSGQSLGRWLLLEAVHRAWDHDGVERVHVHTCSLDHPAALTAYRRAGFVPIRREVERFPDPRVTGVLSRDCAPQIPIV